MARGWCVWIEHCIFIGRQIRPIPGSQEWLWLRKTKREHMATPEGVARTVAKWGETATTAGFTVLPNHLLALNQFLPEGERITPTEMVVLLQILLAWWDPQKLPFPSKSTIARRAGLSPRQVQRAIAALEGKGLISRIARFSKASARSSNEYDVGGVSRIVRKYADANPAAFKRLKQEGPE